MTKSEISPASAPGSDQVFASTLAAAVTANPAHLGPDGRKYLLAPEGFKAIELPDRAQLPPRPTATVTVDDRASLSAYANRYSTEDSILIADIDASTITARLDWHPHNGNPVHGIAAANCHKVALVLRPSEEFARWDAFEGEFHDQAEFARFLEENAADVAHPEAATMIEISRDFEAVAGQTYKSSVRLDNGDRRLTYVSESRAENGVIVPQKFTLQIPIYHGEAPDTLTALFRWRANGAGAVKLAFQWHRVEYQRQAHFRQIAATAADETGLPMFMGRMA